MRTNSISATDGRNDDPSKRRGPRRAARTLAIVLVAGISWASGAAPAAAGCGNGPVSEGQLREVERQLGQRVNDERARNGLPSLQVHSDIASVAVPFAQQLKRDGRLSHNDAYFGMRDRFNASMLAENVGVSCSVEAVHKAFMDSAPHRANILNGKLTHIGLGAASGDEGRLWVVEDFAAVRSAAPAATRPPAPAAAAPVARPAVQPAAQAPAAAPVRIVRQAAPAPAVRLDKATASDATAAGAPATSPRVTLNSMGFERIEAASGSEAGARREPTQLAAVLALLAALGFVFMGRNPRRKNRVVLAGAGRAVRVAVTG